MAEKVESEALKYQCVVVYKAPTTIVSDGKTTYAVSGGNAGLTKGGTGDVLAGVITGLAAMNTPLLAAAAGSFVVKKTAEKLFSEVGYNYSADDVSMRVFGVFNELLSH
jgi:ADP-dependent NAD(P)H-hydrate dehydratase / NAD(P)H-hydrate epimerase